MSYINLNAGAAPATPASGKASLWVDNIVKKLMSKNDAGLVDTIPDLENFSTANQTGFAADTYLAGSSITLPATGVRAGATYRCVFDMVKTAAGVAAFTVTFRVGTAGTTADAAILTFTFTAGTAVADTGFFELFVHFRTVGSGTSAVAVGNLKLSHFTSAAGLAANAGTTAVILLTVTSAGFNSTPANQIMGISVNGGASFSGTNTLVQAQLTNN